MNFTKGSFMALVAVGWLPEKEFPDGTVFGKSLRGKKRAKVPTEALIYDRMYAIHEGGFNSSGLGNWTVSDCWSGMVIQHFETQKQAKYFVTKVYRLCGGAFPITRYGEYDFAPMMDFLDMESFVKILQEARALGDYPTEPQDTSKRYHVQVGRGRGAYRSCYTTDNLAQAEILYSAINIANRYKKRLYDKTYSQVLARQFSD